MVFLVFLVGFLVVLFWLFVVFFVFFLCVLVSSGLVCVFLFGVVCFSCYGWFSCFFCLVWYFFAL